MIDGSSMNGEFLSEVECFEYLGSHMTLDGEIDE